MTQIPPELAQYFPNGLEGADWEELRKVKFPGMLRQWLESQGIDINQKAAQAMETRMARPGLEGQLATVQKEHDDAPVFARENVMKESRKSGTFADTPEFMRGLDAEAGLQAKGIQTASKGRLDELKRQLGIPV